MVVVITFHRISRWEGKDLCQRNKISDFDEILPGEFRWLSNGCTGVGFVSVFFCVVGIVWKMERNSETKSTPFTMQLKIYQVFFYLLKKGKLLKYELRVAMGIGGGIYMTDWWKTCSRLIYESRNSCKCQKFRKWLRARDWHGLQKLR